MYESHPFTFGIDIKNLKYIKHPTETVENTLIFSFEFCIGMNLPKLS